ncbi:MAG: DUF881 domain-containing protein [Halanaerobiales bacterium]
MKNKGNIKINIILIILLLINSILLFVIANRLYFRNEPSSLEQEKSKASNVYGHYRRLTENYNILSEGEVENLLAEFMYQIEEAENGDKLQKAVVEYGDLLQQEIARIRMGETLHQTEEKLKHREESLNNLETRISSLEKELDLVKSSAGFAELSGPGVIIRVHDHQEKLEESSIVHDNDIRTIINELFIAGARGIEVGGERLTVTSAIRCVGPTILVNNEPISVDPIEIKAVGEPETLKSSLEVVRERLEGFGIELEIITHGQLKLDKV